jgi:Na+-driven multidrug efflux pump
MQRSSVSVLALAALVGLGTGCMTLAGRSLGTNIDDKTTTAAVKARLSATTCAT